MKLIVKSILLILVLHVNAQSQTEHSSFLHKTEFKVGYYGNLLFDNGLNLGAEYLWKEKQKVKEKKKGQKTITHQLLFNGSLGYSTNFTNQTDNGLHTYYGLIWRRTNPKRRQINIEINPLGYYRSFLPETFEVKGDEVSKVSFPGRSYYAPSIAIGIGRLRKGMHYPPFHYNTVIDLILKRINKKEKTMKIILSKMTNFKCFNFAINLMLIVGLSIFASACSKDDDDNPPPVPVKEISQEIKDLIYFKGNEKASVVIINAQGGPDTLLSKYEVDLIFEDVDTTDLLAVNVHQAQSLNPSILKGNDLTLDQAVTHNAESIETLDRVIKYFKAQERTVYIVGASFGAFVAQEFIAKKGINVADKYLIMIGRLDINDVMWQAMAEGKIGVFDNGITPRISPTPEMDVIERNLNRIAAGLGMNRYTQELNAIEDLSKVTYVYGATDIFVGRLTAEEVAFLESKNANVIQGSGGHDDTFDEFFIPTLKELFGLE